MKFKKFLVGLCAFAVTLGGLAIAEEINTPTQFRGDVNFDHVALKINNTKVTATAAELNLVAGASLKTNTVIYLNASTNLATNTVIYVGF